MPSRDGLGRMNAVAVRLLFPMWFGLGGSFRLHAGFRDALERRRRRGMFGPYWRESFGLTGVQASALFSVLAVWLVVSMVSFVEKDGARTLSMGMAARTEGRTVVVDMTLPEIEDVVRTWARDQAFHEDYHHGGVFRNPEDEEVARGWFAGFGRLGSTRNMVISWRGLRQVRPAIEVVCLAPQDGPALVKLATGMGRTDNGEVDGWMRWLDGLEDRLRDPNADDARVEDGS